MNEYQTGVVMDTDFVPENSTVELNKSAEDRSEVNPFLLVYSTIDDPYVAIVSDSVENRLFIEKNGLIIVGEGTTCLSLAQLNYGVNHPTRTLYRNMMGKLNEVLFVKGEEDENNLLSKFTSDDAELRDAFNKVM